MNSFIKACEVSDSFDATAACSSSAAACSAMPQPLSLRVSRSMCFGRGEGSAAAGAWDEGRPIMLKQLGDSYFRRAAAGRGGRHPLRCAMPIFLVDDLSAVLVIFCGDPQQCAGALELLAQRPARQHRHDAWSTAISVAAARALEELSQDAYLPRGSGLPAWRGSAAPRC